MPHVEDESGPTVDTIEEKIPDMEEGAVPVVDSTEEKIPVAEKTPDSIKVEDNTIVSDESKQPPQLGGKKKTRKNKKQKKRKTRKRR